MAGPQQNNAQIHNATTFKANPSSKVPIKQTSGKSQPSKQAKEYAAIVPVDTVKNFL
jgi:hypothetical protein